MSRVFFELTKRAEEERDGIEIAHRPLGLYVDKSALEMYTICMILTGNKH